MGSPSPGAGMTAGASNAGGVATGEASVGGFRSSPAGAGVWLSIDKTVVGGGGGVSARIGSGDGGDGNGAAGGLRCPVGAAVADSGGASCRDRRATQSCHCACATPSSGEGGVPPKPVQGALSSASARKMANTRVNSSPGREAGTCEIPSRTCAGPSGGSHHGVGSEPAVCQDGKVFDRDSEYSHITTKTRISSWRGPDPASGEALTWLSAGDGTGGIGQGTGAVTR
ncbi:protein of unknown function [Rhodovastum atsumiense]|nr:protein of unknown function [Rhodovastum atsumiense]